MKLLVTIPATACVVLSILIFRGSLLKRLITDDEYKDFMTFNPHFQRLSIETLGRDGHR